MKYQKKYDFNSSFILLLPVKTWQGLRLFGKSLIKFTFVHIDL